MMIDHGRERTPHYFPVEAVPRPQQHGLIPVIALSCVLRKEPGLDRQQ